MVSNVEISDIRLHAKFVGFTYLMTTIIGLVNNFYVKVGAQDPSTLLENEFRFRTAQMLDLLMFLLVIWMAHALYLTSKSINKHAAQLAFLFRFGEGVLGCVIVLFTFIPLVILNSESANIFSNEELKSLANIFFDVKSIGWNIHLILMSAGAIIFVYLFLISCYIPKWLAYWGLFTYASVLVCFGLQLFIPDFPKKLMIVMAPGALFEFVFGLWFLFGGVKLQASIERSLK